MAKQTLGQGDSNVVVRNQVVYGALPQDVIDRMGDTTLALQTTEQNVLPAINELKSNLTELIPNASKIYFRKQTGTFNNGAVTGLDCPSGFNNGDLVFLSCKYQNSMTGAVLTVGLSSTETTTTYTVYGSNARGGGALSNGSYTWFELWVKLSS